MKKTLLYTAVIAVITGVVESAVIPSSIASVLTNEKRPAVDALWRNDRTEYNEPETRASPLMNKYQWWDMDVSETYNRGSTRAILIAQEALEMDAVLTFGLRSISVSIPGGPGVPGDDITNSDVLVPLHTDVIWDTTRNYRVQSRKQVFQYGLYLPVEYLQAQDVSAKEVAKFVATVPAELRLYTESMASDVDTYDGFGTGTGAGAGLSRTRHRYNTVLNNTPVLLGRWVPITAGRTKRDLPFSFGDASGPDMYSDQDQIVLLGDARSPIAHPAPFNRTQCQDREAREERDARGGRDSHYAQVVSVGAAFRFE